VPAIYHPRRPRASPLWQIVTAAWEAFVAGYEKVHRAAMGPLRANAFAVVGAFLRCGDLASGFLRLRCPDCGDEHLLAFTCKGRHFCPSCHQRRVRHLSAWIATSVCHEVPHRQFVFTIPRVLRGIFRKRRDLLHLLFQTATDTLRDSFRTRLDLPDGRIGAIAAVHTFGDFLFFHPHLHVLAADGLFDSQGRFHCMPAEGYAAAIELFRHRFLHALREAKHISPRKLADLLSWQHSGFQIDGGKRPVPAHHTDGRKRLAQYMLRAPFSLQKITWKPETQTVIYRSKPHHNTKRNFEIFTAVDFLAALIDHIPPKSKHTVRYYGVYSNKTRGRTSRIPTRLVPAPKPDPTTDQPAGTPPPAPVLIVPPPPKQTARSMRPLWRDLILQVWGADPALCPRCNTPMKTIGGVRRPEQVEFFLRLWGLWEGLISIPPPPKPPFDIDTFEPIIPPERAIKQWVPDDEPPELWDQTAGFSNDWNQSRPDPSGVDLGDGRILVPCFD